MRIQLGCARLECVTVAIVVHEARNGPRATWPGWKGVPEVTLHKIERQQRTYRASFLQSRDCYVCCLVAPDLMAQWKGGLSDGWNIIGDSSILPDGKHVTNKIEAGRPLPNCYC